MAVNQDELYAALYEQALARRGGGSNALANTQSWDPQLNPPAASTIARGKRGAALAAKPAVQPVTPVPMTRVGRGGIPTPIVELGGSPGPRFTQGPPGSGGAGRGRTTRQTAPRPLSMVQDAQAKTSAAPVTATAPVTAVAPTVAPTAKPLVSELAASDGMYRTLAGPGANVALNSDNAGAATVQGRFLNKDGTRGPQETRAYTQGGIQDAGKRANVVPGLFSGVSAETEQALSTARQAAADRGDFEAVERSYMTPEQKQAANVQGAENKILSAVGNAPLSQLPQVAQAVSGIQAGRTEAAQGEQSLQKGAMELQQRQQIQLITDELFSMDPTKPESAARKQVLQEQLQQNMYAQLAAQGKTAAQQRPHPLQQVKQQIDPATGLPVGQAGTFDPNTGTYSNQPVGGAQAVPPPEHIQMLQGDPSKEAQAEFEAIYGHGSAAQYLK